MSETLSLAERIAIREIGRPEGLTWDGGKGGVIMRQNARLTVLNARLLVGLVAGGYVYGRQGVLRLTQRGRDVHERRPEPWGPTERRA